nr:sigma-70 family RNA polymerase sigma factor [Wansuia hejianensis]
MNFSLCMILLYMKEGEKVEIRLLVKQAKKGDKEALLRLVMAEKDEYYKLAYIYLKNEDDAMDAMQDMIIKLYENISKLRKEESFYSWSKTILVNECKGKLRIRKKVVFLDNMEEEAIEETYDKSEDKIVLEKYLCKLNEKHKEIIKLRYLLDLDYDTISEILEIPLGTVKSRLSIGMEKLRKIIGGDIDG